MAYEIYNKLTKKTKAKTEVEQLMDINRRIDEALKNEPDEKKVIEALICVCEAQNNNSAAFATMSIAFSVIINGVSALLSCVDTTIPDTILFAILVSDILLVVGLLIGLIAMYGNGVARRRAFVLQALKFRYEIMSTTVPNEVVDTGTTVEEKEYIVKVRVKK